MDHGGRNRGASRCPTLRTARPPRCRAPKSPQTSPLAGWPCARSRRFP